MPAPRAPPASQHPCKKLGIYREGIFPDFVSFISDADSDPIYKNTMQYAIVKKGPGAI